uniref:Skin secreted peptide 5 n=1 Tax=Ascaphus truei TaxID=8439 RepID=SKSP5_ASCTR|nr:RecName: Full=Skin secreted peptide 5 [Ascaphus truei]
ITKDFDALMKYIKRI